MGQNYLDNDTWKFSWHPVCTMKELDESDVGRGALLSTMLLGIEIVVAKLESGVVAMNNRCPHRSSKLHLGWNTGNSVKCAYHGWEYGADGHCVAIPAAPDGPIPKRACALTYDCEVRYGLVWVRIDGSADTQIPEHLAYDNPEFRSVLGPSYNWKTHSARRIENYTDLAHFPFIHPNTLGSAGHVTFLTPKINFRKEGKLRYRYDAPKGGRKAMDGAGNLSPLAFTDYTIHMPFGVTLDLQLENGSRTVMWIWATPLDDLHCRSFWFCCRNTGHDTPDQPHIDMQLKILEEDIAIVESQDPEQIPHPRDEIAVPPDKVSLTYRRCLYDMCRAKAKGPEALNEYMNTDRDDI